jgi:hypothetical protein
LRLDHLSPSSIKTFVESVSMFYAQKVLGFKSFAGLDAFRGIEVERGVAVALANGDAAGGAHIAQQSWDRRTAFSADPRRSAFRKTLSGMIARAYDELEQYGAPNLQTYCEYLPEGHTTKILGYADFFWPERELVVDLKCVEKLPPSVRTAHAQQKPAGSRRRRGVCDGAVAGLTDHIIMETVEMSFLENAGLVGKTGNFPDYAKYDARAGRFSLAIREQADGEWKTRYEDITNTFRAIMDLENIMVVRRSMSRARRRRRSWSATGSPFPSALTRRGSPASAS